jgi:hypothetical protein
VTAAPYSGLHEPSRAVLAQVREVIAEAKAAGRWAVGPMPGTDRFHGAIGVDNEGRLTTYRTLEELHLAAVTRAVSARFPGAEPR